MMSTYRGDPRQRGPSLQEKTWDPGKTPIFLASHNTSDIPLQKVRIPDLVLHFPGEWVYLTQSISILGRMRIMWLEIPGFVPLEFLYSVTEYKTVYWLFLLGDFRVPDAL